MTPFTEEQMDAYRSLAKKKEKEKRYKHSLGVAEAAVNLAKHYGEDPVKAYVCGLLHDIEKNASFEEQHRYMDLLGDKLPREVIENKKLWHAPAGAAFVKEELHIVDEGMINAIKYHTTGRENMTMLEKIIYTADFISAERDFEGVEEIREKAFRNIDEAIYSSAVFTLQKIISLGQRINYDTMAMYNEMIDRLNINKEERS